MDYLCCPACRSDLENINKENDCVSCRSCGCSYPLFEGHVNFVASTEMDDFAVWQQAIYDGRETSQYSPEYADLDSMKYSTDFQLEIARRYGLIMPNWKGKKSRQVMDLLDPRSGERVLDIGCGVGFLLNALHAVYDTRGVGIDFSPVAIKAAIAYNPSGNDYQVADALKMPFKEGSFDLVISYDVIEHVSDPVEFVREAWRVARPGGRILIYTPSRRNRWTWHWWQLLMSRGRYNLGLDNLAGHDPEKFLTPGELSGMMYHVGLREVETVTFHTLYTLIMDEVFPGFMFRLLDRPSLCDAVFKVLELADAVPNDRDYGNGFFAYGWKE
jgi:2-polyprenyl-3-methyl-5-hydroxy-6-metoxy-1,4-benzoquinol methylase